MTSELTTVPARAVRYGSFPRRWLALYGVVLLAYAVFVLGMCLLDATVWHHQGYLRDHLGGGVVALLLGAVAVAWASWRASVPGPGQGRNRTWLRIVAILLAVLVLGWGAVVVVESLRYDMTFLETGGVGASFAILGIWFGLLLCAPVATALLAVGLPPIGIRRGPRPRPEPLIDG